MATKTDKDYCLSASTINCDLTTTVLSPSPSATERVIAAFHAMLMSGAPCALAVVLGPGGDHTLAWCERGGGGWEIAARMWRAGIMEYVIAIAPDRARVLKRAPLLLMAKDRRALRDAAAAACAQLDDVQCLWIIGCDADAEAVVRAAALADAVVAGHA